MSSDENIRICKKQMKKGWRIFMIFTHSRVFLRWIKPKSDKGTKPDREQK
jgi:hypothetical protein